MSYPPELDGLEGTTQAIYSTLGVRGSIAVFTLISGPLRPLSWRNGAESSCAYLDPEPRCTGPSYGRSAT